MIVADAANFLLGGVPGDLHDEFVMDVEPGDLKRASVLFDEMSGSVRTIHVTLSGSVASLEGRWRGDGAAAFDSEIWQPLSHGLGVLERECATAASELARLSVQAEQAHFYKVEELNQEIQTQLYMFAGTTLIGSPELGGVIAAAVGGLAARLGGELVGRIVAGLVDAISALLRKVVDAFYELLRWAAKPLPGVVSDIGARLMGIIGNDLPRDVGAQTSLGSTGRVEATDLREQLAMQEVASHPSAGVVLKGVSMKDPRWPASAGWVKMAQNVNGVSIHYVYNTVSGAFDDFKFK